MKNINLTLLGVFLLPLASICQPTITSSFSPVAGTIIKMANADTTGIKEGPAGANKTYDFTNLIMVGTATSYTWQSASSTPYASSFPGANLAFESKSTGGTSGYTYIKTSVTEYMNMGVAIPGGVLAYTDPQLYINYPFTMGGNANDKFSGSTSSSGYTTYRYGSIYNSADGYGTLKLPKGTFTNVLRVKTIQYLYDSIDLGDDDYFLTSYYTETYNFLSNDYKQQLLGISYITLVDIFGSETSTKSVQYYPDGTNSVNGVKDVTAFNLFPNPAVNSCHLELPLSNIGDLKIKLTDITGKIISVGDDHLFNEHTSEINTSNIPSGIYFVQVYSDAKLLGTKKLVVSH